MPTGYRGQKSFTEAVEKYIRFEDVRMGKSLRSKSVPKDESEKITDDSEMQVNSLTLQPSSLKKKREGTSLVVQWLKRYAPKAGGSSSIPGQGTESHMPQLRPLTAK